MEIYDQIKAWEKEDEKNKKVIAALKQRIKELEGILTKIKNMDRSDLDSGYRMYENLARKNERIKELEAALAAEKEKAGKLVDALNKSFNIGHNDDCIFCGFKDKFAKQALKEYQDKGIIKEYSHERELIDEGQEASHD